MVLAHGTEIPKQYWTIMLDLMRFKKNEKNFYQQQLEDVKNILKQNKLQKEILKKIK